MILPPGIKWLKKPTKQTKPQKNPKTPKKPKAKHENHPKHFYKHFLGDLLDDSNLFSMVF